MNFAPKSVYARGVLARPLTSPLASRLASLLSSLLISLLTPLLIALLALSEELSMKKSRFTDSPIFPALDRETWRAYSITFHAS